MFDFLQGLYDDLSAALGDILSALSALLQLIWDGVLAVANFAILIGEALVKFFQDTWAILSKLGHVLTKLGIPKLWHALQKWYGRFNKWVTWYQQHILAPINTVHQLITHVYDTLFRPIIETIDSVRVMISSVVGIFDRKLAAKLDSAFFKVEQKILAPISYINKRLNEATSMVRAILTAAARFDGTIFIDTVLKHVKDIRRAWLGLPWNKINYPAPQAPRTARDVRDDLRQYMRDRSGPMQPDVDHAIQVFRDTLDELK